MPDTILVEMWGADRYAPGMFRGRPKSDKWMNAFRHAVIANGGPNEKTFIMSLEDAAGFFTPREIDEIYDFGKTVKMSSWTVANLYGYNAVEIL